MWHWLTKLYRFQVRCTILQHIICALYCVFTTQVKSLPITIYPPPCHRPHPPNPSPQQHLLSRSWLSEARERCSIPVVQKTLKSQCFLKGQRANKCTSTKRQYVHLYMSEMPDHLDGLLCADPTQTPVTLLTGQALSPQAEIVLPCSFDFFFNVYIFPLFVS